MQEATVRRRKFLEKYAWAALVTVTAAWAAFLFFQRGQLWDETEHAHAAWLISQGKRPLDDFFEHHQPLLWSLLALYYRVGLTGVGVLIWGRFLVVLSGLAAAAALLRFGHLYRPSPRPLAGWLGVAAFIGLTVMLPPLFVSRPETISAALFLVALWLWNEQPRRPWDAAIATLAGALAGASFYSSPRFVLLGGLFVLCGAQSLRRWAGIVAGGIGFVVAYTVASGFALDKVIFNLEFSAILQTVGDGTYGPYPGFWSLLAVLCCSIMAALLAVIPRGDRWRTAMLIGYTIAVFLACDHLAGLFQYAQAYAPFVVGVAVTCAWMSARLQWPPDSSGILGVVAALIVLAQGLSLRPLAIPAPPLDFLTWVRFRERLAASVPAGETVLLYPKDNPVIVADASYYGIPLWDSQDRLCRAVRKFQSKWNLPPCDFLKVLIDATPYLTEESIGLITAAADSDFAHQFVEKNYRPVFRGGGPTPRVRSGIMRRLVSRRAGQVPRCSQSDVRPGC